MVITDIKMLNIHYLKYKKDFLTNLPSTVIEKVLLLADVYPSVTFSVAVHLNCLAVSSSKIFDSFKFLLSLKYVYLASVGFPTSSTIQLYKRFILWLLGVVVVLLEQVRVTAPPTCGSLSAEILGVDGTPETYQFFVLFIYALPMFESL